MGNLENESIDTNQLVPYLKEWIGMNDLINLKKALLRCKKITELNKYDLPISEGNKKFKLMKDNLWI